MQIMTNETRQRLADKINELHKQFPEVSFAKLSRVAVRVANFMEDEMMKNTIDADLLREKIESIGLYSQKSSDYNDGRNDMKIMVLDLIDSLQQEQPETLNNKFTFPKFLYARTTDNKTMDVSYAPQSLDATEYIRNDFFEQEQPDVDLEKEIDDYIGNHFSEAHDGVLLSDASRMELAITDIAPMARHFYELGLNTRKEE